MHLFVEETKQQSNSSQKVNKWTKEINEWQVDDSSTIVYQTIEQGKSSQNKRKQCIGKGSNKKKKTTTLMVNNVHLIYKYEYIYIYTFICKLYHMLIYLCK